jgi:DUF4097 and DUF4098 domain-containing protein YvlB
MEDPTMNERERILDLVKKGVLSSEEGLVLLENLANQGKKTDPVQETMTEAQPEADTEQETAEKQSNPELDELNSKRAKVRTKLDTSSEQLADLRRQQAANDEQIIVYDTMEDLDTLTPDKAEARTNLKSQNKALGQEVTKLEEQRNAAKQELNDLDRQIRQLEMKDNFSRVVPDDWQDQAKSAAQDLGKAVSDASSQIGSIVRKTAKSVMDNVDWKDVTVRVPGIATQKFSHTFTFANNTATVLDVSVANGNVQFRTWDSDDIQVQADIRFFGKVSGELLDEFTQRSNIEVDGEHFIFQVPNKRIEANLVISLPRREYDHVAVRNLNGDMKMNDLHGKDLYAKTTNGDLKFNNVQAVMVEAENVNGDVKAVDAQINSAVISTVNGNARFAGRGQSLKISTVNGDVKVTLKSAAKSVNATSVNGAVKVALPEEVGLSGQAKTRFGSIRSRMTGIETPSKQRRSVDLVREGEETVVVNLSTVTGEILIKDTDKEK